MGIESIQMRRDIMQERINRLKLLMEKDNVDGVLYATSGNLQYFLDDTSFWWQRTPDTGGSGYDHPLQNGHFLNKPDCILYVPVNGEPVLIMTFNRAKDMRHLPVKQEICYYVLFPEALSGYLTGKRIACGESCESQLKSMLQEIDPNIEVLKGEQYGEQLRQIKDASEISTLRRAAAFTDRAMAALVPGLCPGKSPREIEGLLVDYGLTNGILDLPFAPTCHCTLTGTPRSEELDGYPQNRAISPGTALAFDFGYLVDGYCSDFGRSFYCGRPEPSIESAYKALQEAQLHLLATIKPGMRMNTTYGILHEVMEKHGCGKYLRNYYNVGMMGHQIGIDVHERPWLHDNSDEVYMPGMVMCIEPKFWAPGKAYLRVEDMVLVTETGCESLTCFDRQIFQLPG